jgi:hypothetical protein
MPTPTEPSAERARVDALAIADTTDILRQLAAADRNLDARRGEVSASLAALVEIVGRRYQQVPEEVATRVMGVVRAVDAATGHRR